MQIIIDLAHDNIDVVQAVFAAYCANTPTRAEAHIDPQMPLALADDTPKPPEYRTLADDIAAPPAAEAKPKRGRKPAVAATPAVPPPPPTPEAETYEQFLPWLSGQLTAGTFDARKLQTARESVGIATLFELSQHPELIPAMRKALES